MALKPNLGIFLDEESGRDGLFAAFIESASVEEWEKREQTGGQERWKILKVIRADKLDIETEFYRLFLTLMSLSNSELGDSFEGVAEELLTVVLREGMKLGAEYGKEARKIFAEAKKLEAEGN